MKRYQNPDLFEALAMRYVVGTLHGKARSRFETLMQKRLYLRAVTEAYQQKFAPLAEFLPAETPPARVWQRISQHIEQQSKTAVALQTPWRERLSGFFPWLSMAMGSVVASVLTVVILSQQPQPTNAYMATLKSPAMPDKMLVAMIEHDDMMLSVEMPMKTMPEENGMTPVLWCLPKQAGMPPMRMGELAYDSSNKMPIDKKTWQDMAHIQELVVSLEPAHSKSSTPTGKIIFNGTLSAL